MKEMTCLSFWDWFCSLNMIRSGYIHFSKNGMTLFFTDVKNSVIYVCPICVLSGSVAQACLQFTLAKNDPELMIPLPLLPMHWDYRLVPPPLVCMYHIFFVNSLLMDTWLVPWIIYCTLCWSSKPCVQVSLWRVDLGPLGKYPGLHIWVTWQMCF